MELCERVLAPSALVKEVLRMLRWLPAAKLSSSSRACRAQSPSVVASVCDVKFARSVCNTKSTHEDLHAQGVGEGWPVHKQLENPYETSAESLSLKTNCSGIK